MKKKIGLQPLPFKGDLRIVVIDSMETRVYWKTEKGRKWVYGFFTEKNGEYYVTTSVSPKTFERNKLKYYFDEK